jgi:pantetheine-phosphate adenylyltransferase
MKKALLAGTFDPPTLGHLDLIQRASRICDKLYVGVTLNSEKKKQLFSIPEKKKLLAAITKGLPNVEIVNFTGLVVDFAKKMKIDHFIRGIRSFSDFEYECQMASANHLMTGIETVFLMSDGKYADISSSLIKEIAGYGGRLHPFIPKAIEEVVYKKLSKKR